MTTDGLDTPEARLNLEAKLPALADAEYEITSPRDHTYNCIAWAAGDDEFWWEPGIALGGYYWPEGLPNAPTVENYERAYKRQGYRACDSGEHEPGFEKVALYVNAEGTPTHAARQIEDGRWASKCGKLEDIVHSVPDGVGGDNSYGQVHMFLRRPVRASRPSPQARNLG